MDQLNRHRVSGDAAAGDNADRRIAERAAQRDRPGQRAVGQRRRQPRVAVTRRSRRRLVVHGERDDRAIRHVADPVVGPHLHRVLPGDRRRKRRAPRRTAVERIEAADFGLTRRGVAPGEYCLAGSLHADLDQSDAVVVGRRDAEQRRGERTVARLRKQADGRRRRVDDDGGAVRVAVPAQFAQVGAANFIGRQRPLVNGEFVNFAQPRIGRERPPAWSRR